MDPENVLLLTELGLSQSEARVFLRLAENGLSTAKVLSEKSKVRREFIYRILIRLEKKGLVEEVIESPKKFLAVPLKTAYQNLVLNREKENQDLHQRIEKACRKFPAVEIRDFEDGKIVMLPQGKAIEAKIKEELDECNKIDIVIPYRKFFEATHFVEGAVDCLIRKKGKIRIITEKQILRMISEFSGMFSPKFLLKLKFIEFRYGSRLNMVEMILFDCKKIMISTTEQSHIEKMEWLYSNNLFITKLAKNYFETLWASLPQDDFDRILIQDSRIADS